MKDAYEIYKTAYQNGVVKQDPESMGKKFDFDDWPFSISQKDGDGTEEFTIDFAHATSRVLTFMHEVLILEQEVIEKDEKHVLYFRKNFPEYFN